MKLLIVVVLASCLLVKIAEGADGDTGAACKADKTCTKATDSCINNKCVTKDGEDCTVDGNCASGKCGATAPKKCLKSYLASCTAKTECAIDACSGGKCGKMNGDACTVNRDCVSGECKLDMAKNEEKCGSGAAAIASSLLLMLSAALTSRFM